jgi:predicted transcriptional regulator
MTENSERILALTAQIVSAYLVATTVATEALPGLIQDIHQLLIDLGRNAPEGMGKTQPASRPPIIATHKSIFPDHLICLEDGLSVTMLKRHLITAHGLTPDEYRAKWSLPATYPMIAPSYAQMRSRIAKESGLGISRKITKSEQQFP